MIFLSLVDSGDGTGPLPMMGFGVDDAMRKRYNVAASRAKDQLWVVHSLDAANDLKPGDMRKRLIDYAADPHAAEVQHGEIKAHAESPFERPWRRTSLTGDITWSSSGRWGPTAWIWSPYAAKDGGHRVRRGALAQRR